MNIKHVSLGAREHEDMGAWRAGGGRANLSICPRSLGSMCARVGWIVDCEMWTGGQQIGRCTCVARMR